MTKDKLTDELNKELTEAFPGVVFNFSQIHQRQRRRGASAASRARTRSRCSATTSRATRRTPTPIVDVMGKVPGIKDLGHVPVARAAEHQDHARPRGRARATGSTPATSTRSIQAAIGGQAVTQVYEGEKHFDLTVRWKPQYRMSLEAIREITVSTPDGAQHPARADRRHRRSSRARRSSTARTAAATRR